MERKPKSSLAFIHIPIPDKIVFGRNAISDLTTNAATFPDLPHLVADLQAKNHALETTSSEAESGDHEKVAAMHNAEKEWDIVFRDDANYVSTIAAGDSEIIRMGGFTPTKAQTDPTQKPVQPENFNVSVDTQQGSFTAKCNALDNAKAYVYVSLPDGVSISFSENQVSINAGTQKISLYIDTHRLVHFGGMVSGVKQNVIMFAVNNAGIGPATAPQTVIPQ
jgi:hypothetical protein